MTRTDAYTIFQYLMTMMMISCSTYCILLLISLLILKIINLLNNTLLIMYFENLVEFNSELDNNLYRFK